MTEIRYQTVKPEDKAIIELIGNWYLEEWGFSIEKTIQNLKSITTSPTQFQVLMTLDGSPIATGGIYNHVGLIDREPKFNIYKNWLSLVYTIPNQRQKGYGALICNHIQDHCKNIGINKIHLFTDTAESLYKRLDWAELERLTIANRNIVVMEKNLVGNR